VKFQYLGTAAAEGWLAIFCACENCERARKLGWRNIRTRSQAIIDDKLLIDFPPDTYMHVLQYGLDLSKIESCLITHNHEDHLYPDEFLNRTEGFAHIENKVPLKIYGTEPTRSKIARYVDLESLTRSGTISFICISPFVPFNAGGYEIIPLKANHSAELEPVFFIIGDGEKTVLYAHDTGYFPDETWRYLEEHRPYFNFVSLDCTLVIKKCRHGHMGIDTALEVKERLIELSCADKDTVFCLNHFSHNGDLIYDELVPVAEKHGFLVSYDGMTLEI